MLELFEPIDCFNSHTGYGFEGELDGWWHEVCKCPHCGNLFYREMIA